MASGIHVQLELRGVTGCPASSLSEAVTVESVTVGQGDTAESTVVGEMTVAHDGEAVNDDAAEAVFEDGSKSVYRYTHDEECPCSRVPTHGCPVRGLQADDGRLRLAFIAPDLDTLRAVASDLESCCDDVAIRRLVRGGATEEDPALLVADRNAFTDRQYEVLKTAHEMGYFDSPKSAKSDVVADELGVSVSTFVEHLSVAQTKLLDQIMSN
ncbi:helix-turn-helix domain-containing protein [Haloplanus halophilus]|uniref:helix-turn-helix domain-containing protein n=1 Tax=Haloplanus halophilus TaxID=2949993 RepID=UPI00203FDA0A|nr:helix-turn-helix domain-containing protein [Haloplanus sp. GDY1]